jgi:hypothetical protein
MQRSHINPSRYCGTDLVLAAKESRQRMHRHAVQNLSPRRLPKPFQVVILASFQGIDVHSQPLKEIQGEVRIARLFD